MDHTVCTPDIFKPYLSNIYRYTEVENNSSLIILLYIFYIRIYPLYFFKYLKNRFVVYSIIIIIHKLLDLYYIYRDIHYNKDNFTDYVKRNILSVT